MKFCHHCAEYVSEDQKECPSCGYVFQEQSAGKSMYYCTRCKRHLLSKICPIHGTESSVKVESANSKVSPSKQQLHQPKRENLTPNERIKPNSGSPVEKTLPVSKPFVVDEKKQGNMIHPVPLSRPVVSPKTQPTMTFSELPRAKKQNTVTVINPETKKQPVTPPTNFTVNSGNGRQSATFPPRAIIEGKLSSPVENPNSDLIMGARKKMTDRKKTDHRKKEKFVPKSSVSSVTLGAGKSFKNRVPGWIYWAGSVVLVIVTIMALYSFYYPDYVKNLLFSRAEDHFQQGRHEAALKLYHEYKMRYPGDDVIPAINQRISQIHQSEIDQNQKQILIYSLMQKAAECYNQQRFLKPDDDNAMIYIREILQEDPGFVPALALQNRIVDFYFEQAEKAFDEDRYDRAVMYYENILAIRPTDTRIQADLNRALKLKYVSSMLDDISSVADARQELKNFQEEKSRLKNQIRQERQKLQEASQEMENKQNDSSKSSKTADKRSSSQEVLNAKPIAAGFTYLSKPGPAQENQLLDPSVNQDRQQSAENSKNSANPMPDKYQIESASVTEEPVQFTSKKRVLY